LSDSYDLPPEVVASLPPEVLGDLSPEDLAIIKNSDLGFELPNNFIDYPRYYLI